MNKNVIDAMAYAIRCHQDTNHLYSGQPYVIHLSIVVNYAFKYLDAIPEGVREDVIAACWLHDVIEDCRQTYNDVKEVAGETVAEIVYAVTNEKGKTRKDRANDKYYDGIRGTAWATYVKLCDRLANVYYSKITNSSMLGKYRQENETFIKQLSASVHYKKMIVELQQLLK